MNKSLCRIEEIREPLCNNSNEKWKAKTWTHRCFCIQEAICIVYLRHCRPQLAQFMFSACDAVLVFLITHVGYYDNNIQVVYVYRTQFLIVQCRRFSSMQMTRQPMGMPSDAVNTKAFCKCCSLIRQPCTEQ